MPSVPTKIDGPVVVIGDVHGQTSKLQQIVKKLATVPDINQRWIVFIGDLVDRGPDSKGTIDAYCQLADQHDKVTWVCGNHELAMAGSIGLILLTGQAAGCRITTRIRHSRRTACHSANWTHCEKHFRNDMRS